MDSLAKHLEFLSEPPQDYLCPICTDPLSEPYLTDCGHHLCCTCRGRLLTRGKTECPECREQDALTDARLNKHLQRQVNSLKVRCQHHEVGCQWVGELRYLQEHLDPVASKCSFILFACPLGCGERLRGSAMKNHMLSDCSKRPYDCDFCGYYSKFDIVTEQHYPVCEQFPVECPNACSRVTMKRRELARHLEEQCPLQVIQCPFTSAGCTVQLPRREMEEHEKMAVHQHLRMMMSLLLLIETHQPSAVLQNDSHAEYLYSLPPVEFLIPDFLQKSSHDAKWVSPPFYSHPQGYKLCLVVYPNGVWRGRDTHVSIFVNILNGEHDNHLVWPLDVDIVVELCNWKDPKGHLERTLSFFQMSKDEARISSFFVKFVQQSSLSDYLMDGCVRLTVKNAILYSTALLNKTPSWQNPHQSLHEFTLTQFSKRNQYNGLYLSSPFYTSRQGYKLCCKVCTNGFGRSKDTHISILLTLMAGEYDDQLKWPYVGKIDVELLNWRENKGHHKITLSIDGSNGVARVKDGDFGESWGALQFISLSHLKNNAYLLDDCLRFRLRLNANTHFS